MSISISDINSFFSWFENYVPWQIQVVVIAILIILLIYGHYIMYKRDKQDRL